MGEGAPREGPDLRERARHEGSAAINTNIKPVVVFDLGGVLIDWDPRYLYRNLFDDESEMERFLAEVTTPEWNRRHDAGRRWEEGIAALSAQHPDQADLIAAHYGRWEEMLAGPISGTVEILGKLVAAGYEVHALTNWSSQTFPIARERYEFLDWFQTIVVSGEERLVKPDPRLYRLLLDRIGHDAGNCIFIDDAAVNVDAAGRLGFDTIRFRSPQQLGDELAVRGIVLDRDVRRHG
ncbi:MAG: HAD family phosphatase [Actinomycetota bacterium]|nr:HAD family phosphatase [Actinomycetota bacterium]